ncbi:MAG: hypothetical protein JWN46_75 [Acidimicrobiales bacterium]|nr:hypothetical protein [Acidimicrobiales bacterium]
MECGEILGCSPATIMRWEKGERLPRWDNALLYAAFLGTLESITHAA